MDMKEVKKKLEIINAKLKIAERCKNWKARQELEKRQTDLHDIIFTKEILPQLTAFKTNTHPQYN